MAAAAFFDLDRTLLRRSSALALAGSFRDRGLISRRQLAKAVGWHILFALRGAGHEAVRRAAVDGLLLLRGFSPDEMRDLVAEAMEPILRPLVYAEPLDLVRHHRERGDAVYIVSATLQEIVQAIADDLGFDGALGTVCEVRMACTRAWRCARCTVTTRPYACATSRPEGLRPRRVHGVLDSHTDLALLEEVGHPVAVNPDRKLPRRIAVERGWPVLEFRQRLAA